MSDVLESVLIDMEYPATREDLLRAAVRSGCEPAAISDLRALSEQSFHGVYEVRQALSAITRSTSAAALPVDGGLLLSSSS
jgi:hypothetical protein